MTSSELTARSEGLVRPHRASAARGRAWPQTTVGAAVLLGALVGVAVILRARGLSAGYWSDEGISVGIASHPLAEIPQLLRQDGSPPLYYFILHAWIRVVGDGEAATHLLSAGLAVLAVPAGWWAAVPLGRAAGAATAALVALSPFIGLYANEARMYSLVLLLALLATGSLLRGLVLGDRRHVIGLALLTTALLYTHSWGVFFFAGMAVTWMVLLAAGPARRRVAVDGALALAAAGALFVPWLPSLAFQAAHTGAPWSRTPSGESIWRIALGAISERLPEVVLLLVAAGGVAELVRRGGTERRMVLATVTLATVTLVSAWVYSRLVAPAWAMRYLLIVVAPVAVAVGAGLHRMRWLGVAALVLAVALDWRAGPSTPMLTRKSNVDDVAADVRGELPRGSLVYSPKPELVPTLARYLPGGVRYVTPLGTARDPQVMDWRDALARLERARYADVMDPVIDRMRPGQRLAVVEPRLPRPTARWTVRVREIASTWNRALRRDGRLRVVAAAQPRHRAHRTNVGIVVLERSERTPRG